MDDLIERYRQTNKGRHIVTVSKMWDPVDFGTPVYKNGEIHYRFGKKILNVQQAKIWQIEQEKILL